MSETTLTEETAIETSTDKALLDDKQTTEAEVATEETHTDQTGADETAKTTEKAKTESDDEKWLKSVGVDPKDPEAVAKLSKIARDNMKAARTTDKVDSTKLREQATAATQTGDVLVDEVRQLRVSNEIRDFNDSLRDEGLKKSEITAINDEMAALLEEKPHLAKDLGDVYLIIKSRRSDAAIVAAKQAGRKEAKAEIAKSSTAGAPKGNASESVEQTEEDSFLKGFNKKD